MPKVMIVDDHPVVRLAVRMLLEKEGCDVVAEADNGVEAVSLAKEMSLDIIILDICIPKLDGFEVIERIRKLALPVKILVLSSKPSPYMVARCMQAGASGYIGKGKNLSELIEAIKVILNQNNYFPSRGREGLLPAQGLNEEGDRIGTLSNRELMVLQQLVEGLSNKYIADYMLLSPKTISTYKTRILKKLNANSLADLIEIAKRNSIL
jgi:two-component system, NarL family, response regulator EvgA